MKNNKSKLYITTVLKDRTTFFEEIPYLFMTKKQPFVEYNRLLI